MRPLKTLTSLELVSGARILTRQCPAVGVRCRPQAASPQRWKAGPRHRVNGCKRSAALGAKASPAEEVGEDSSLWSLVDLMHLFT